MSEVSSSVRRMETVTITLTEMERAALEHLLRYHGNMRMLPAHRTLFEKVTGERLAVEGDTLF